MIARFISVFVTGFITLLLGVGLYPVITQQLQQATNSSTNVSTTSSQLLQTGVSLFPILFILTMATIPIVTILSLFKRDFDDYSEDYDNDNEDVVEEKKPRKQTYLEYVKERITAQKLIHHSS